MASGVQRHRLRAGDLSREFYGVRAPRGESVELVDRCRLLLTGKPQNWAICGPTAALLHGLPLPRALECEQRLHVIARAGANVPRTGGVIGTRTRLALPTCEVRGVRVLAPEYAWASLAPLMRTDLALIVAGERLWDRFEPLVSVEQVDAMLAGLSRWKGIARLRRARARMRPGTHSPRETRLRLNLEKYGIPTGVPNGRIDLAGGEVFYGDLVLYEYKIVFEYDGEHHGADGQRGIDARRLNALTAEGWLLVLLTRHDGVGDQLRAARRALRARGWSPAR
ncbi:hypothetical protein [Leucobacter celer]|uniref:hypothetical protein n=1 Tax=Leucobacter celer TaxID=668625 RepID=UPI0012FA5736|nr:hypothetical protein [Leucobacter celer]